MVPVSLLYQLDGPCLALFTHCDLVQGAAGRPARNFTRIAEALGMQPDTVRTHAQHLVDRGVIRVDQVGRSAAELVVLHNPARGRVSPDCSVEPVDRHAAPPKAGSRAGHRGRRGKSRQLPGALSRVQQETPSRVEQTSEPCSTRDTHEGLSRVQHAPVQVYEGVSRSGVPPHARAVALLEREFDAVVIDEFSLCRGGCDEHASENGWCGGCAPF